MAEKVITHPIDKGKSAEQLFSERNQRVVDATLLKQPDRIPVFLGMGYMAAGGGSINPAPFVLYGKPDKWVGPEEKGLCSWSSLIQ